MLRKLATLLVALTACSHSTASDTYDGPIIDMHMHAHAATRFGHAGVPNPVTKRPSSAITDEALVQATVAAMDKHRIVKAFASSELESVARYRAAAPDRIIGGAQLFDVGIATPAVERIRAEVAAGRIGLIGEIGNEYSGISPTDPALEPYFALAEELDVPVGIHTGIGPPNVVYDCCPKFRAALGNPLGWEPVLAAHPKLRVYFMHAGYPFLSETISMLSIYPRLYVDVAVIDWIIPREEFHAYLQALVRAGFEKRIMFGSDQMIWPEAIDAAIEGVASAPFLSPDQKRGIFYDNAVRFLGP